MGPPLEYWKSEKIVELSSFEKRGKQENLQLTNESTKRKGREGRRLWEEEEKRIVERLREERKRRLFEEEMRVMEEREKFAKIRRYEESLRRVGKKNAKKRRRRMSKKEAPDFLDIIKDPMDLSTIRDKVRRMEYKDRVDFRHDVFPITSNAHAYNDGPFADQLLELCDYLLDENHQSLAEAEAGLESRNT
ncbi:hypothetical protein Ddye_014767 [Dipteronia dyeriana]|uniref:Bromo domain-containing protein n=1 Tax=Dipteronia dyeriana TaxID=168575 RepID=A0AAD9U4A7_9ROSI|nr:hypothetical protein Ddye_014767 [Dipteronia dyeriana]